MAIAKQVPTPKIKLAGGETDNTASNKKLNVSVANRHSNDYPATKTTGVKVRGTGAATKGLYARGPMA